MSLPEDVDGLVRIKAFGVGGGGGNAVSRMAREAVPGIEYIAVNTDAQALARSDAPYRLRIGDQITRGLGAGGNPEIGRQAAEESRDDIYESVKNSDNGLCCQRHGRRHGNRRGPGHCIRCAGKRRADNRHRHPTLRL